MNPDFIPTRFGHGLTTFRSVINTDPIEGRTMTQYGFSLEETSATGHPLLLLQGQVWEILATHPDCSPAKLRAYACLF
ncbi:MAG: hypothetical protein ACFBSF_01140 [Leptolyngbyaceae cyanobacterium]